MVNIYTYTKQEMGWTEGKRTRYTIKQKTKNNETLVIELSNCESGSLQDLWLEHGYIKNKLKNWIHVEVFATDENGLCWGKYNPQIIKNTNKINFKWILEDTEQNRQKILSKIAELAGLKSEV